MLSACVGIPKNLIEPKVELQNVSVADPTFSEATLVFNFQVENPNPIPLKVDTIRYNLALNGKPFTTGELKEGLNVESNATKVIPLPVRVRYSDLASGISSLLQSGSTPYNVDGSVKIGLFSIPFKENGEVKISQ